MIVPDAGLLANALADDGPEGAAARAELRRGPAAAVPHLVDVEVLSVLRKQVARMALTPARAIAAIEALRVLPYPRHAAGPYLARAFELRDHVTAYDAMYVALAEALSCDLVTIDGRLARAPGLRCEVRLLTA